MNGWSGRQPVDPGIVQIEAITFDVGGTLIEPCPSVGHVYAEVAARHGVKHASAELLESRFQAVWRARGPINDTRAGWEEAVDEVFSGLTAAPPSTTFFPELYDRFARAEAWRIFDDVEPTLRELAVRGIRLGVISNWDERLRGLLRHLHLDTRFEIIIISCEVGAAKPDPAIFERAARALGLPPNAIGHIGDSLAHDVEGAAAAGFQALQIRRGAGAPDGRVLKRLSQLTTIIDTQQAKTN
jgi:putative hydrolase of the HAD superfamily